MSHEVECELDEFLSLPKDKQRVEIAKDVLKQLDLKRLVATHGKWVDFISGGYYDYKFPAESQVRSILKDKNCGVCALGGLFVASVERANALVVKEVGYDYGDGTGVFNPNLTSISNYLTRFFDQDQINDIELAFEKGKGGVTDTTLAKYYEPDVTDPEDRMRLIMNNIIDNGGTFIHGVTQAPSMDPILDQFDINVDSWDQEELETIVSNLETHGQAYADYLDNTNDVDNFEEYYRGHWDSEEAFAENLLEETGDLDSVPSHLRSYFDMEAYAQDLFYDHWISDNGHVFSNN